MTKEILCTLGPVSMNPRIIRRLTALNVSLFRINLSHTALDQLPEQIRIIQNNTDVPVCLDSEGAQVRTGTMSGGAISLTENMIVRATMHNIVGDAERFTFYPLGISKGFQVGDFISIDFNAVLVQVIGTDGDDILMRVLNGGRVGSNKAVTVARDIPMPALTEKDRRALDIGLKMDIKNFALSFANHAEDVFEMRRIVGHGANIISKIECLNGLENLDAIADASDALLIDRGDLSRQVPIERIPEVQKRILKRCHDRGKKVYVATNLLESMIVDPTPTRAEVNDIYNTLADGADGLVLAAETAIGAHPIQCANMIIKMIARHENNDSDEQIYYPDDPSSLLVAPHGGRLIHREATVEERESIATLPALTIAETDLMDCEQFAHGTYSPLSGFMGSDTLNAVLDTNRLPDGTVWTLPIVLTIKDSDAASLEVGMRIALKSQTDTVHALIDITEIYHPHLDELAQKWFGTTSDDHPGVRRLMGGGKTFIAGPVSLVERLPSPFRPYELTPAQTRFIFTHKGWSEVVGFHGRNPAHQAHEYIQLEAMRRTGADGLFISPVIGPKKHNDFMPKPILESYQLQLKNGRYPEGSVVLGSFATYSRYSGPREAVFTALCRKNMGCNYFIIGRDHTGVGDFYAPDANRMMFDTLGDIGIMPVYFDTVGYDPDKNGYVEGATNTHSISGTEMRERFRAGQRIPSWFMRDEIQDMILSEIAMGHQVFND